MVAFPDGARLAAHAADLTARLVAIDSVNPRLVPGGVGEGAIAAFIAAFLREHGFTVTVQEAAPGRPNVLGWLPGAGGTLAPLLILTGHTDTVGVAGMAGEPFVPVVREGRLYGRGAFDMKGGLGAILAAGAMLARQPERLPGGVLIACCADEEYASIGTEAFVAGLTAGALPGLPSVPARCAAILCEPTQEDVTIAHKGFAWLNVTTQGRAAHGSDYSRGVDAIVLMGRVLAALARFEAEQLPQFHHPLLGRPSIHASTISGGGELSTYPARCTLQVERRTLPGESRDAVAAELAALLAEAGRDAPDFAATSELFFWRDAYEIAPDQPVVTALVAALQHDQAPDWRPAYTGGLGWTDAALFGAAGIPTVIYGPAGAGAHSAEEYVTVASLGRVAATLVATAAQFLP